LRRACDMCSARKVKVSYDGIVSRDESDLGLTTAPF
jgi:hypothetical protein